LSTGVVALACRLAKVARRLVEQASEQFSRGVRHDEATVEFYANLTRDGSADIDLEDLLRRDRRPHLGLDL
jgi:hypothetical protein